MPRGKRASAVCSCCHERKIQCSLDSTGPPCEACKDKGRQCQLRTRKSYTYRRPPIRTAISQDQPDGDFSNKDTEDIQVNKTGSVFVGCAYGIRAAVEAAVEDRHTYREIIPAEIRQALTTDDLQYLRLKGCFSLFDAATCRCLMDAYFTYAHPLFPVVDAETFLKDYAHDGLAKVNLLLVWSMFSVSASYITPKQVEAAGYTTKKAMKESIVERAKLLFDHSHERNKIVLVQSSLLISFWFNDAEDVKQSWYWSSIAFGIAHSVGLHRNLDKWVGEISDDHPPAQRFNCQNIWWACILRDAWLSFGMGRPLRLSTNASDCAPPLVADNEQHQKHLVMHGAVVYENSEACLFAGLWSTLLSITNVMREVLDHTQNIGARPMTDTKLKPLETTLRRTLIKLNETSDTEVSFPVANALRHVRLYANAALCGLFGLNSTGSINENIRAAAVATNDTVRSMLSDRSIAYVAPVAVPLIYQAMQTHIQDQKSSIELVKRLVRHNLDLLLMFLDALSENYPSAVIVRKLYNKTLALQSVASP